MKLKLLRLKQVRDLLLPPVVMMATLFLTGKFLLPKMGQQFEFYRRLKKNEAQVLSLEKKATFLKEQQQGTLFADFEKVEQVLPSEKDVAALLVSLESLKQNSRVEYESFDLRPGALATGGAELDTQQQKEFELRMIASSSYDDLINFLEKLENTAPLTRVEKMEINFQLGKESLETSLLLKAYCLPLKEERLEAEEPLPELSSPLKETLARILGFEVVPFKTALPEEAIGKEDPFSY